MTPDGVPTPPSYQVLEELGRGAMGIVYRARQTTLDRDVALKLVAPGLALSDEYVARFRREARSMSRLEHPHLISVYDTGLVDGHPYIAMELVPGATLAKLLDLDPVAVRRQGDRLFEQVLAATAALHRAGLVHRDLKPANIMVTPDGHAKVMDLGLVKDAAGNGTCITQLGALVGTPMYLAPEVLKGRPAEAAADVWALGCLYHAVHAGRPPFAGSTMARLVTAILEDPLPDLAVACPDLPPHRRDFLASLLSRTPGGRPKDAIEALARFREAPPPLTLRPEDSLPRTVATHRVTGFAALAAAAAIVSFWSSRTQGPTPAAAPLPAPSAGLTATSRHVAVGRQPVLEALERIAPRALHRALCDEIERLPKDPARRRASLDPLWSRWRSRMSEVEEAVDRLPWAESDRALSWRSLEPTLDLYRAVVPLWQLEGQCEDLGIPVESQSRKMYPSSHRPLEHGPIRVRRSVAILYGRAREAYSQSGAWFTRLDSPQRDYVHFWTAQGGHMWLKDVNAVGLSDDRTTFTEPMLVPFSPPGPDEDVVLTVYAKDLGPTESLSISLSRDGSQWSSPMVVLRGDADSSRSVHHHLLHPELMTGPRRLRFDYQHRTAVMVQGDAVLQGFVIQYVPRDRRFEKPRSERGGPPR